MSPLFNVFTFSVQTKPDWLLYVAGKEKGAPILYKCYILSGHAGSQATLAPGLASLSLCKNLSASVNELSDEQLSGFSNISTTLRRASSFNPSSPGGEIISRCGLRLSASATASAAWSPYPRQVMQYLGYHSLLLSETYREQGVLIVVTGFFLLQNRNNPPLSGRLNIMDDPRFSHCFFGRKKTPKWVRSVHPEN